MLSTSILLKLYMSQYSSIFQVSVGKELRVLKVYHTCDPFASANNIDITEPFLRERRAYHRLKAKGLCHQGVVPYFYRDITRIDPKSCRPFLDKLMDDKLLPNAILLEYIPNLHHFDVSTFSEDRAAKLGTILDAIHNARIHHGDPHPRNMMIQKDTGRVLWMDFDFSHTYSESANANKLYVFSEHRQGCLRLERRLFNEFLDLLKEYSKHGKMTDELKYFYDFP
ncbi:hypothetical protein F5884DRAFT_525200 [Xylogone sp. PMI_703]|nr:hypothetical protein F5884DRAFT_525200 [Xylogone sp. PMI_703]